MIEENRNSIIIRDVKTDSVEFSKFERAFSIYDLVYHKYTFHSYALIDGNLYVPATVTPETIQSFFPSEAIVRNYAGTPTPKKASFKMKNVPRSDVQSEALAFLVGMKTDQKTRSRMLNLATGTGKTYVSIAALSQYGLRGMVIVDSVDLANQWKKEFLFHTDMKDRDVMIISGEEAVTEAKKDASAKVFIAILKTLGSLLQADSNAMNDLTHKLGIGVRIFDECHTNFKAICDINELSNVAYTIYLTATPNRSDYKEDRLYGKVFGKIPFYDGHKNLNAKYHTVVLCTFNSHPTSIQMASVRTKYGFSVTKWADFITNGDQFSNYYKSLKKIIDKFKIIDKGLKVAIMLPTIDLIEKTKENLVSDYGIEVGEFIGEIPKDERAVELGKTVFLTNQKIFGKGIDVPDLDCIINYVQLSSKVNLEQIMGRLRNNEGHSHVLIDVTDTGFAACKNQQRSRKSFYKTIAKSLFTVEGSLESDDQ
jgi:superfamily II DNA or RNA helicase